MSGPTHESDLLRRAIAGDRPALDRLMALYCRRLVAFVTPRIPTDLCVSVQIEDVLQEVSLEVLRRIGTFRSSEGKSFYVWLCRIAEHRILDMVRAGRAAKRGGGRNALGPRTASMTRLLERVAVDSRTPSRSAAAHEAASAVLAAMDHIPEACRLALRLRYLEGMAPAEIATQMARTKEAVRLLCHRGLKHLADELGPLSHFLTRKG